MEVQIQIKFIVGNKILKRLLFKNVLGVFFNLTRPYIIQALRYTNFFEKSRFYVKWNNYLLHNLLNEVLHKYMSPGTINNKAQ